MITENEWYYEQCPISKIKQLLIDDYEIEVETPDGYQPVTDFIQKGMHQGYEAECNGKKVQVSQDHLFETEYGWLFTYQLLDKNYKVLCDDGKFHDMNIKELGYTIPIVDISVNHKNARYYTNGISSHNTGGGKSIFLCHHAAACLKQNKNVLYITCEMSEESVSERIDANIMNVTMEELRALPKQIYDNKFQKATSGITGKIIVKEYPTSTASVINFDHLLSELKVKKNFIPDVIFIDYLNICASARYKSNDNSYMFVKSIAEELRGFAVRHNVPVFTASQVNRGGINNSDVDLTNTSESMGVPHTADLMLAIISNDGLDALNQVIFKQLKNRRNDATTHKRFVVGIDRSKMKFFDLDESAQNGLVDTGDDEEENKKTSQKQKGKFENWN